MAPKDDTEFFSPVHMRVILMYVDSWVVCSARAPPQFHVHDLITWGMKVIINGPLCLKN